MSRMQTIRLKGGRAIRRRSAGPAMRMSRSRFKRHPRVRVEGRDLPYRAFPCRWPMHRLWFWARRLPVETLDGKVAVTPCRLVGSDRPAANQGQGIAVEDPADVAIFTPMCASCCQRAMPN